MKNAKKLASLMLALLMVMAMSVTAFAANSDETSKGKITIQNTIKDAQYSIYRIFYLESFTDDTPNNNTDGSYSYKVSNKWQSFFTAPEAGVEPTNGRKYVNVDANGYVTWKDNAKVADFAKDALAYATAAETNIAPDATQNATADNTPVVFSDLILGYYLVDSSVGTVCALDTTNPEATIIEKNTNPSLVKEVKEGTEWGSKSDANIGDRVDFRTTITVHGTANDYVMHDKMDEALSFGIVERVELNGALVTRDGNYDILGITNGANTGVTHTDKDGNTYSDSFDVVFTENFCEKLKSGDKIVVYYYANLTDKAVVREPQNNNAHLEYKDNNGETHNTEDSNTKTYTWEIPVLKYANGNTSQPLSGADFALFKTENVAEDGTKTYTNAVNFKLIGTNTYQYAQTGVVTKITTDATGRFKLQGLDAGTYYLKELKAPTGYNKLNTVVKVVIDHNGYINAVDKNGNTTIDPGEYESEIGVNNQSGTELPSTGGMGTTIFYIVGGVLLAGAVVLLVTKKRMSVEK